MSGTVRALTMPRWGMTMTEGTISNWLVAEGTEVTSSTEIVEIETSKVVNVLEAPSSGVLRRQVVPRGSTVPVGALIGVLADPAADEATVEAFISAYRDRAGSETAESGTDAPRPEIVRAGGPHAINLLSGGEGDDAVVLIHGFGGDLSTWTLVQPALVAAGRRAAALDLPAHGGSAPTLETGSVGELAEAVAGAMAAAGIGRAHLVGHSLGGAVAIALAQHWPELARSLALIAPAGLGSEIDAGYIEDFLAADRRRAMKSVLERLFADPSRVTSEMVEGVLQARRLDGVPEALRSIAAGLVRDGCQALDLRAALAGVAVPILVLWGEEDRIIPTAQAAGLPGTVHVLPGTGHMPQLEQADAVVRLIADHLARAGA